MTPQSGHLELVKSEPKGLRTLLDMGPDLDTLSSSAAELARSLAWIPGQQESQHFRDRCEALNRAFKPLFISLEARAKAAVSDDFRRLQENMYLVSGELQETCATFSATYKLPQVRTPDGTILPRVAALAEGLLAANAFQFSESSFTSYIQAFQQVTVLKLAELWMLIPVMKVVLLEHIAERGRRLLEDPSRSYGIQDLVRSLQEIKQTSWKLVIEPLILFDQILRQDPAGAYPRMDYETRELYRKQLVRIADRCDYSDETRIASEALGLAREAQTHRRENPA